MILLGRVEHSQQAPPIAKIVPDKAQSDDNADALARFKRSGAILASAPTIKSRGQTLFCCFIVKNKRLE